VLDSTRVLAAVRSANRLDFLADTPRAVLEASAAAAPDGLTSRRPRSVLHRESEACARRVRGKVVTMEQDVQVAGRFLSHQVVGHAEEFSLAGPGQRGQFKSPGQAVVQHCRADGGILTERAVEHGVQRPVPVGQDWVAQFVGLPLEALGIGARVDAEQSLAADFVEDVLFVGGVGM
jgi:hypothetical protein